MSDSTRLLYVEDCEATAELLQMNMSRYSTLPGLTMQVADSVSMGIDEFSASKHSAVLLDWNLPDGNGCEVAKFIRTVNVALPIIFLSSVVTDEQVQQASVYGPQIFLEKGAGKEYVHKITAFIEGQL